MIKRYIKLINCFKNFISSIRAPQHYFNYYGNCVCFKYINKKLLLITYYSEHIGSQIIEILGFNIYKTNVRFAFTAENINSDQLSEGYIHITDLQTLLSNLMKIKNNVMEK